MNFKTCYKFAIFFLPLLFFSCAKKNENFSEPVIEIETKNHNWFCFENGKINRIKNIKDASNIPEKPYTISTRISEISTEKSKENQIQKGFAIVNQIGFLTFEDENFYLSEDTFTFSGKTADNLIFYENIPFCGLYTNSFFQENYSQTNNSTFLVKLNPETQIIYKVLNSENITKNPEDQITDFLFDGNVFSCIAKNSENSEINFKYISFQTKDSLLNINPQNAEEKILVNYNSIEEFRNAKKQEDFSKAPERIKKLLKNIGKSVNFEIKVYTTDGISCKNYINQKTTGKTLQAQAVISENWTLALFQDGTIYLDGFLNNGFQINKGKICALRLPKLPNSYIYTGFSLSDNTLYVSWEKTNFVNTSNSGFLQIKLSAILKSLL